MTASRASRSFLLARACVLAMACSLAVGCGGDKDPGEAGDGKQAAVGKDGKPAEQKVEAVPVEVARASRRAIAASYTGTANLEAPGEAQVVAKTSGVMVQLLAEEGDQVRAGQVLARIDGDRVRLEAQRQLAIVNKLENNYRRARELEASKLVSAEASDRSSTTWHPRAPPTSWPSSSSATPTSLRRSAAWSPSAWSSPAT